MKLMKSNTTETQGIKLLKANHNRFKSSDLTKRNEEEKQEGDGEPPNIASYEEDEEIKEDQVRLPTPSKILEINTNNRNDNEGICDDKNPLACSK